METSYKLYGTGYVATILFDIFPYLQYLANVSSASARSQHRAISIKPAGRIRYVEH